MAAGGPGDYPITDILIYRLPVYGNETDELIRKIGDLSSRRELDKWWAYEVGWDSTIENAREKSKAYYEQLLKRAKESGWEVSNP